MTADLTLELVLIPVSHAGRAKRFYVEQAGFGLLLDGSADLPGPGTIPSGKGEKGMAHPLGLGGEHRLQLRPGRLPPAGAGASH
jgi:hypothetical protein